MKYLQRERCLHHTHGAPVIISKTAITVKLMALSGHASTDHGFRNFYFSLGATAETNNESEEESHQRVDGKYKDEVTLVSIGVCPLFKLGKAHNILLDAPGRLSIDFGSMASAADQFLSAVHAEELARQSTAKRRIRQEQREKTTKRENPLLDMLLSHGFLQVGNRFSKKTLTQLFSANPDPLPDLGIRISVSRSVMVDAPLESIRDDQLVMSSTTAENLAPVNPIQK